MLEVLQRPLPVSGGFGLGQLLQAARAKRYRIWAVNSPFEVRDDLKAVGYRWDSEVRCWNLETSAEMLDAELRRLKMLPYSKRPAKISLETLDAWVRCSGRPGEREERTI